MAFKMKGPSLYRSPLAQKKTKGFGPKAPEGNDDQSKEMARSRYEMGEYKVDPTKPTVQDDKALDKAEDAAGVGKGSNRKVMKDGAVNKTQAAKIAKGKAEFAKKSDAEKKDMQDTANAKRKAFEATPEYKARKKAADTKAKRVNDRKKGDQGDFTPGYEGADISESEYKKRLKSGSTKRD